MRSPGKLLIYSFLMLFGVGLMAFHPTTVRAQDDAMKQALMTFVFDLHEGVKNGNLTPEQKAQVRNDLQTLRQAKQNGDRRAMLGALMNFHQLINSGAFQPQDAQRIKQDMRAIRQAKQASGGGMGGGGMGGGGMMGGNP
jgi:Spy/CpxP family protein refolding chaperone